MTWGNLNERQRQYLQAIYDQDQENERYEKSQWTRGYRPRPAIEWRWMYYGIQPLTGSDSPLRSRLRAAELVDPGTGATFEALEKRGYILCRYQPVVAGDPLVYIQITPKGRKLVREGTGAKPERALPPGTLREWHWRALALAWQSRPAGVQSESGYYGHIGWNTWLRLRDYKAGALIEEYQTWQQVEYESSGKLWHETRAVYWLRLTPFGEQYYRDNWQRYHELYPSVDAPHPEDDQGHGPQATQEE